MGGGMVPARATELRWEDGGRTAVGRWYYGGTQCAIRGGADVAAKGAYGKPHWRRSACGLRRLSRRQPIARQITTWLRGIFPDALAARVLREAHPASRSLHCVFLTKPVGTVPDR